MNENTIKEIQQETDFVRYIKLLSSLKNCVIIIAVKDTIGYCVQPDGYKALRDLGLLKINSQSGNFNHWKGYLAILENGKVLFEKIGKVHEPVFFKENLNSIYIDCVSAPFFGGNIASVLINGAEYGVDKRGFNIVPILRDGKVIDSVAFDTHVIERKCIRREGGLKEGNIVPYIKESLFNRNLYDAIQRLNINYITAGWNKEFGKKIKVRLFFFGGYALWTAIESVMEEFKRDERFDILIIMAFKQEKTWSIISKDGYNLIFKNNYNIEDDCPDIIIYNHAFGPKKDKRTTLSAYVAAGLNNGASIDVGGTKWQNFIEKQFNADIYIVEKHLANRTNWYGIGNPKFDIIYRNVKQACQPPIIWEKLKNKTVILWAPDHQWTQKDLTFDLYVRAFIDYFSANCDMGLIIRMHPVYLEELLKVGVWSSKDIERLISYFNSFSNILWDDSKDYGIAYSMADAVITDINCGITISSLPLDVPVAVTLRFDGEICQPNYPDVIDSLYKINSVEEAYKFFDDVKHKRDPLRVKRKLLMDRYVANFDGKNGLRIKEFIEEKYFEALNRKRKDMQVSLVSSLLANIPSNNIAIYLGNHAAKELYLTIHPDDRNKIKYILDDSSDCECADLGIPVITLDKIIESDVRNILVTTRTLPSKLNDFLRNRGNGIHIFGLYGWFEANGYYTRQDFFDYAVQYVDDPLPSKLSIPDFLHQTADFGYYEIIVAMIVRDENAVMERVHSLLMQSPLSVKIHCFDLTGKAFDKLKDYWKVDNSILVEPLDDASLLPAKMNELIYTAESKYIMFLGGDEFLHAKGLFYLYEAAEEAEADVIAAGDVIRASKDGKLGLADFTTGYYELKKDVQHLPATYKDRYKEWHETDASEFTGNKLYRLDFLRKYNIRFSDLKSGWREIFCIQTIFWSPKYIKLASPVCISSAESPEEVLLTGWSSNAKEVVSDMFAYQQTIEKTLVQMNSMGGNASLCDQFREWAMSIFDRQYFSGLALDDEMRKAVSQTVQEELQKNPSIGMWWIKYLFMRSSFPQNV